MNESMHSGYALQVPASVASTATTSSRIDCAGFDFAKILISCGTQTTTDPAITTITLKESDDTVATNFAAIAAFTGGTATSTSVGFVIPAVTVTGLGAGVLLQVDLRKRKRYLLLNMTPGTTLVMAAHVELTRAEKARLSAATKTISNGSATSVTAVATLVNG